MSFIQLQKAATKGGEKVYVNLARSVRKGGKHPTQERTYLGVLEGEEVRLTKRVAGGTGCTVALSELKRRAGSGEDLMGWLEERAGAMRGKEPSAAVASVRLVEVAGPAHVLGHYARETGLAGCLAEGYGVDGVLLLALAMHQAVTGQALYLAQGWLEEARVEGWRELSSPETSALMIRVGADDGGRERFFRAWIAACGRPRSLIFDTTSISTHSTTLELAEWGYNRDHEDLPQVNLALVSARQGGAPLFYRTLPGSIPDVATLATTGELLREYGLADYTASLDRGFYSAANVAELLELELGFIMGAPFSNRQAQELLRRHRTALASTKRSLCFEGRAVRHVQDVWVAGLPGGKKTELAAHLYHDPVRHATQAASIERRVFELADRGNRLIAAGRLDSPRATAQWVHETAGYLARCLKVRRDGDQWRIAHQPRAVALAVARKGYSVVLASDPRSEPVEVLANYRARDQVEKLFDAFKNDPPLTVECRSEPSDAPSRTTCVGTTGREYGLRQSGQHRLRTGGDQVAAGRLMVAFLGLALRQKLEAEMRRAGMLERMSVAEVFAALRKVAVLHTLDGNRHLLEIPKKTRQIIAALQIPAPK